MTYSALVLPLLALLTACGSRVSRQEADARWAAARELPVRAEFGEWPADSLPGYVTLRLAQPAPAPLLLVLHARFDPGPTRNRRGVSCIPWSSPRRDEAGATCRFDSARPDLLEFVRDPRIPAYGPRFRLAPRLARNRPLRRALRHRSEAERTDAMMPLTRKFRSCGGGKDTRGRLLSFAKRW